MWERIDIKGFQSLADVSLDLGKWTAIQGETDSGKSAILRSIHALAFNIQGNSHVTIGHKYASITLTTDKWIVTLERGVRHHIYRVTDRLNGIELPPFEKLNKGVPDKIKEILQLSEVNFSDQYDPPFLLKVPGSEVARVFGELTNVNEILLAISEGNKTRGRISAELKLREKDLAGIEKSFERFADLGAHKSYVENLESSLEILKDDEEDLDYLSELVDDLDRALADLDSVKVYPEVPDIDLVLDEAASYSRLASLVQDLETSQGVLESVGQYPDVPDMEILEGEYGKWFELRSLIQGLTDAADEFRVASAALEQANEAERVLDESIHSLLVESGSCPTCLQTVK